MEYWTTFSSSKEKKNFFSPLGATFFSKHNNGEKNDSSMEVPLCSFEGDSNEDLKNNVAKTPPYNQNSSEIDAV